MGRLNYCGYVRELSTHEYKFLFNLSLMDRLTVVLAVLKNEPFYFAKGEIDMLLKKKAPK